MATNFKMTARDMVTQAMREIGVLASGENPSADELADGILRLNSMLKAWAAKGLNLWRNTQGTVDFAAGISSAAIPEALTVGEARLLLSGGTERPLALWESDQYAVLPNKGSVGVPVAYTMISQVGGLTMQLWPVPSRDVTIRYSFGRITADVIQPSDPVDVPQMFQEAVWLMLAVRMAPTFGKARTDPQTVQLVAARAAELERDMLDFDRPASYQLGTDLDGYP
ncbi:hypothetical protein [Sphingomonas melonis]|uniref:Uncharacterized protein n=1 Tax=Sphingomonas melonis TaxID=152682 RepID=A0A7Y9FK11_9SPHN|nr:hypothetical protein [Sphingomonas melonis]NYD88750.1 hypothetical protein [Sphingomonas melonis]